MDLLKRLFLILQIAVVCLFLGRAWQHLFWDAPYRTLLWDEQWMKSIVQGLLQMDWQTYVRSPQVDQAIQNTIRITGVFYLLCAVAAIAINQLKKWAYRVLYLGSFSLVFLAFLESKEHFFYLGQFLEYTLQFACPVFLVLFHRKQTISHRLLFWMKIAMSITFIAHGLFAIGYYPTPGYFVEMVMNIMGVGQETGVVILKIAAILDFIAGIIIFLPGKMALPGFIYMVIWGFGTTIARIWGYFHPEIFMQVLHQWVYQSLYRVPHFMVPLLALLYFWKPKSLPE